MITNQSKTSEFAMINNIESAIEYISICDNKFFKTEIWNKQKFGIYNVQILIKFEKAKEK